MNNTNDILTKIVQLTTEIETDYPELYRLLEENPMTLPSEPHPEVDKNELEDYLQSLQQLLGNHLRTHRKVYGIL